MGRGIPIPDKSQRYVLLLKNPRKIYLQEMEGSARERVNTQLEKFLDGDIPSSAFTRESKFRDPLRQIKDRGSGIRGLGTWCSGEGYDLFVLQALYRKEGKSSVLSRIRILAEHGDGHLDNFSDMPAEYIESKAVEWDDRDDVLLFRGD